METNNEMLSFRVLGQEINFKPQQDKEDISPEEVVGLVNKVAEEISQSLPHLDEKQIAVLAALRMAQENLKKDKKTQYELDRIRSSAADALRFIEEVSPSIN